MSIYIYINLRKGHAQIYRECGKSDDNNNNNNDNTILRALRDLAGLYIV